MKQGFKYILILFLIILADQGSKLWVYANMELDSGGHINIIGRLFKLTYVLNYGMAFSIQLGFKYGKLLITVVRVIAAICIAFHIIRSWMRAAPKVWIWGWICVLGGAIGNSIDSVFYGVYLNNAPYVAPMKWFHGQVIDMLHIDIWSGLMPSWLPIWGGQEVCCLPIFNVADVAIFAGLLVVFVSFNQVSEWEKVIQSS